MILGVDISTSITGFAVVADDQIVYYDSIDLRKYKDVFDKTIAIKEKLTTQLNKYILNNLCICLWAENRQLRLYLL